MFEPAGSVAPPPEEIDPPLYVTAGVSQLPQVQSSGLTITLKVHCPQVSVPQIGVKVTK